MKLSLDLASLAKPEKKSVALTVLGATPLQNSVPKVSNSQVQTFLTCRKRWQYNYLRGWVPKVAPRAMQMGNFIHSFLDVYYQLIKDNPPTSQKDFDELWVILEGVLIDELKEDASNGEEVLRALKCMRRYVLEVSPRIDAGITVLGSEVHFEAPMETPKGREFILEGYVDLLYQDANGKIKVRDHKTTGKPNGFWNKTEIEKDIQQSTYIAGLRLLDYPVFCGEVNQIVTYNYRNYISEPIDKLFQCTPAFRPDELLEGAVRWYSRVVDEMINETAFIESIEKGRCAYCFYNGPCNLQQQGKDDEQLLQLAFRRKDGWSEFHAGNEMP